MKTLHESLLDDEEILINDIKPIIKHKLKKLFTYIPVGDGIDCYGRKLNVGDMVMYPDAGSSIYFGIIVEFTSKDHAWCFVSPEGDPDGHCDKIYCEDTFKISEKQFLELTKDIK